VPSNEWKFKQQWIYRLARRYKECRSVVYSLSPRNVYRDDPLRQDTRNYFYNNRGFSQNFIIDFERSVAKLPSERQYRVFFDRVFCDHTFDVIAKRQNITPSPAKRAWRRAVNHIFNTLFVDYNEGTFWTGGLNTTNYAMLEAEGIHYPIP